MQEMPETQVQSLGQDDPLEKEMATHSSILGWRIPRTREAYSPWDHKGLDMTEHEGAGHRVREQGRARERGELWAPGFHYAF